ncbi:tRNA ligase [Myriangium duriaei CBS 260.36]|uniref:tRNA ligase n=1 Tax=Myriangium duriaei CBS 260.36 TaxID=1168546 RepID=A0A9P4J796_9PEZI|nr:tRNA ligase [Myriangium duriaei CBS 260.36]
MAAREDAPFKAQSPDEVGHMVKVFQDHRGKKGKGGFSCRASDFPVQGSDIQVTSWKMQDWDYKKPHLPSYARGLFTYKNSKGRQEIAVRGYDKFFNHGEVRKTEWPNVEKNTVGPYELSVKENGCIIFISGLEDGTLLVCSKHSTGPRTDVDVSHASVGEKWVDRHMAAVGKTRHDLAKTLRAMNATAVAELCDDEFEEHVLAYTPDQAGLYLHGINVNLPEFMTYPAHLVDQFAEEWGFKKTMHIVENDIRRVRRFLDDTAETGNYAGRDTEGFVIRCRAREVEGAPYEDWFFKYKFEEPYLMYRQWRECTKALIAGKEPRYKKHKKITEEYLKFARRKLLDDPTLAKRYNQNHGIIGLRDDFLAEMGVKGSDIIKSEQAETGETDGKVTRDIVLVPIATIGCGKTTVALALARLFGWGHVQNDNIQGKGRPARFATLITQGLMEYPVMIADRNNHQKRERKQLIEDVSRTVSNPKFVALHYVHERGDYDYIRQKMRERIFSRGDRHQTIHAGTKGQGEIIEIMEGFMHRFEPLDTSSEPDDMFDLTIDLDVTLSSRENLERVVSSLESNYPQIFKTLPSAEDLDNAIEWALNDYNPSIKHEINGGQYKTSKRDKENKGRNKIREEIAARPKPVKIEYFGAFLSSARVTSILEAVFNDAKTSVGRMYRQLQQSHRIQQEFHVTLIHRASAAQNASYWDELNQLYNEFSKDGRFVDPELGKTRVMLERVVWNDRLMCFVVRLVPAKDEGDETQYKSVNAIAHITVGTASESIKPKESNDLLAKWNQEGSGEHSGIQEILVKGFVELPATVKAVMQRR